MFRKLLLLKVNKSVDIVGKVHALFGLSDFDDF